MRILTSSLLMLATVLPAAAYTHARRGPTSPNLFKRHSYSRIGTHTSSKPAGPRVIDADRAAQIQAALIKSGYLTGTPSGHWDSESQSAMQKLQGDQGWQTRLTPDSRALILLGLGPNTSQAAGQGSATKEETSTPSMAAESHLQSTFTSQQ